MASQFYVAVEQRAQLDVEPEEREQDPQLNMGIHCWRVQCPARASLWQSHARRIRPDTVYA